MADGGRTGPLHALGDGVSRVLAAPVILVGTIALVLFYGPSVDDPRHVAGALLLVAFLSGGILDRYARRRPTRARGFFAACGAHLGAMLRIWLCLLLFFAAFHAVVGDAFANPIVHQAGFVTALVAMVIVVLAQVRVAVEDRRSALGALLAALRFAIRNPAALVLVGGFELALLLVALASEAAPADGGGWAGIGLTDAWIAAETFIVLSAIASAVSLFQSRLAHAGYTAAPPPVWPDSPAGEAIANAPPTMGP